MARPFHFEKQDPILGSALVIDLPPSKKGKEFVRIDYETVPGAPVVQWLAAELTTGKHQPFMYTVSGPIQARGWIPLDDTPQARVTYTAAIHTDEDVLAVVGAKQDAEVKHKGEFLFTMPDAVAPSQIALQTGDLRFRATGPRSGVFAEKPRLKPALQDFADTEALMAAGEKLLGAYPWDRLGHRRVRRRLSCGRRRHPRALFSSRRRWSRATRAAPPTSRSDWRTPGRVI